MYGNRFADMWRGADLGAVREVWAEALAGFTASELKRGLEFCLTRDWPPTLPEFVKVCRPPLDYEAAFVEAVEQMRKREENSDEWTNAAIYWAAAQFGRDLQSATYLSVKNRWHSAIDHAIARIADGSFPNVVPKRLIALPDVGGASVDRETAKARVADLMATLSKKMKTPQ